MDSGDQTRSWTQTPTDNFLVFTDEWIMGGFHFFHAQHNIIIILSPLLFPPHKPVYNQASPFLQKVTYDW